MIWKGKKVKTYSDIGSIMESIMNADNKKDAKRFMTLYRKHCLMANQNVGYITGYYSAIDAEKMRKLFFVEHPIFKHEANL